MDRKEQVVSNLIWRFMERCGAQLVSFVVSIVLARLLMPEEYGRVALITVFISVLNVFVDSGFGNALIQKKNADNKDFSTVFFFNIVFCILIYMAILLSAPSIASFYRDKTLVPLIRILSLTIVISGVKNVQQVYVMKHLVFKKFFYSFFPRYSRHKIIYGRYVVPSLENGANAHKIGKKSICFSQKI